MRTLWSLQILSVQEKEKSSVTSTFKEKYGQIERTPACNTGFASGGVTFKLGALCFYSSSVLVDCFVLRNPPERKAAKR